MLQKSLTRFNWKSLLQPWLMLDWFLLILPLGLTILGGIMIRSASRNQDFIDWSQHWITGGVGLGLTLAIARYRYEQLLRWHWVIYGITIIFLIIVRLFGTEGLGAQRWLSIGGFYLQPSEFAKIGIIITIAAMLHQRTAATLPVVLQTLAVASVPWALVFLEPNLGTSLVFGSITLGMLYWGNANPGWLILMLSPVISAVLFSLFASSWLVVIPLFWVGCLGIIGWRCLPWQQVGAFIAVVINLVAGELGHILWGVLKEYQKDRLILFLDPDKDPLGGGYHLIQSRIAVGAGGLWGRGLNQGTQTQLSFIPEQWTDFIFTAIGEELGFIGAILVLLAFWLICLRLVLIAQSSRDNFGSLIAIGLMAMIIFQVLVNIGMTIGLSPVTGIPLPFLSYGRSAMLANFIGIGLAESIALHRRQGLKF